jgi:PIN domain nuclease of toxin-antitoxin system
MKADIFQQEGLVRRRYFTPCSISWTAWPTVARKSSSCVGFSIYLTDTHTLVWALSDPAALGAGARAALADSPFTASAANLWELVLKARKPGALVAAPLPWWKKYVIGSRIPTLAIRVGHIRKLAGLPDLHKDPFDRILVAQALAEGLTLATKDTILARYGAPVVWE